MFSICARCNRLGQPSFRDLRLYLTLFDQEKNPILTTLPGRNGSGNHGAEVRSIRAGHQGSFRRSFYSCSIDGSILALGAVPGGRFGGGIGPAPIAVEGWCRRAQAVNSVDAVLCDEGRRGERTVVIAATDGGLQLAVVPADPNAAADDSAADGWAMDGGLGGAAW